MELFIGIYVKNMFLGTPLQFDNTFGGGIDWATVRNDADSVGLLAIYATVEPLDVIIQEFPNADARETWFGVMNAEIDIAEGVLV